MPEEVVMTIEPKKKGVGYPLDLELQCAGLVVELSVMPQDGEGCGQKEYGTCGFLRPLARPRLHIVLMPREKDRVTQGYVEAKDQVCRGGQDQAVALVPGWERAWVAGA